MLIVKRRPLLIRTLRKVFYFCAQPMQKTYWYIFRPYRPGAKTFIFYHDKLLLVRIGYAHKKWVLPGGGIERWEESAQAAVREAKEESGVVIDSPIYVNERSYNNQYKKVTVFYYTDTTPSDDIVIDGQEVIDAGWFDLTSLPDNHASRLDEEIVMYNKWRADNKDLT